MPLTSAALKVGLPYLFLLEREAPPLRLRRRDVRTPLRLQPPRQDIRHCCRHAAQLLEHLSLHLSLGRLAFLLVVDVLYDALRRAPSHLRQHPTEHTRRDPPSLGPLMRALEPQLDGLSSNLDLALVAFSACLRQQVEDAPQPVCNSSPLLCRRALDALATDHMSHVNDPVLRRPSTKGALASIEEKPASAPQRLAHTSHTRSPRVTWLLPLPAASSLDDCRPSRCIHLKWAPFSELLIFQLRPSP
eukprot:1071051-Prymnesium_polylepis.1